MARKVRALPTVQGWPSERLPRDVGELLREVERDFLKAEGEPGVVVDMSAWYTESAQSPGVCVICLAGAAMRQLCASYRGFVDGRWSNYGPGELVTMRVLHPRDAERLYAINWFREGKLSYGLLALLGLKNYEVLDSAGAIVFDLAAAWAAQLSARGVVRQRKRDLADRICVGAPEYWRDDETSVEEFHEFLHALAPAWDAIEPVLKEEFMSRMPT